MSKPLALILLVAALPAFGEEFSRAGWREYSLQPHLLTSRTYDFDAGASARIDGGAGIGLGFAQHLNDHFAVGVDFSLSIFDLRAHVVPVAGNPDAAFDSSGTLDRGTILFHGTWNVLAKRTTPFLTAGLGATRLDLELDADPPASECWAYPFWGRFCASEAPTHGTTRFTYAIGAGLRHDLPHELGFLRFLVLGEFIDWSGEPDRLATVQLRADFGLKF